MIKARIVRTFAVDLNRLPVEFYVSLDGKKTFREILLWISHVDEYEIGEAGRDKFHRGEFRWAAMRILQSNHIGIDWVLAGGMCFNFGEGNELGIWGN